MLCDCLENLGEQYIDAGRVEDGLPYYLEAKELRRQLHFSHPEKDEFSMSRGEALHGVGGHLSPRW